MELIRGAVPAVIAGYVPRLKPTSQGPLFELELQLSIFWGVSPFKVTEERLYIYYAP